jgi:hypothetical protein
MDALCVRKRGSTWRRGSRLRRSSDLRRGSRTLNIATGAGAWQLGDAIIHAIVCAAGDGCPHALEDAYGKELAKTVREYAPNIVYEHRSAELPVDFRRCRELRCSNGSERAALIAESELGLPVTAFTRVVDRRDTSGALYLQMATHGGPAAGHGQTALNGS